MEPHQPGATSGKSYNLSHGKVIQPLDSSTSATTNPAVDLIRQKLAQLYSFEPDAKEERAEVEGLRHRSSHQAFMYELSHSGKSLAQIQTDWHNYYMALPDHEKHQVWQEFYTAHDQATAKKADEPAVEKPAPAPKKVAPEPVSHPQDEPNTRTVSDIKEQLLTKVKTRAKPQKSHLKSLAFGLSSGLIMLAMLLFGFFNERFLAPFMTPSRAVSSTPLIIDPSNTAVDGTPKIIIPKINVEIPVVYDEPSVEEAAIQVALERGVVHYATTSKPGELGNGVIFGHSANNILNKGDYKFAFVLLKKLETGDTFYIQKDGKRYVYRVFDKKIVPPTDISVLNPGEKPATFTLITCDPPGTNINRLVVVGEQISPDPSSATPSSATPQTAQGTVPSELPGDSPTLWSRVWSWISG